MVYMTRTNIDIDDDLIAKVMKAYRLRTKREAVDLALRKLISSDPHAGMLALEGIGWEGDLDEMRRTRYPDW
jgi:Arc/MetJ family transcription regulator